MDATVSLDSPASVTLTVTIAFLVVLLTWWLYQAYSFVFLKPLRVLRKLRAQGVPGYPFCPLIGQLPLLMKAVHARDRDPVRAARTSPVEFLEEAESKYGPVWSFQLGAYPTLVLSDPDLVHKLYISHIGKLRKSDITKFQFRTLGNGLGTSDGELWRRQRHLLNPLLKQQEVKRLFPIVARCAEEAIKSWEQQVTSAENPGEPLWMDKELRKLTYEVTVRATFGGGMRALMGEQGLKKILEDISDLASLAWKASQLTVLIPFMRHLPTPLNISHWRKVRALQAVMQRIISARLEAHNTKTCTHEAPGCNGAPSPDADEVESETGAPGESNASPAACIECTSGISKNKDKAMAAVAAAGAGNGSQVKGPGPSRDLLQFMLEKTAFEAKVPLKHPLKHQGSPGAGEVKPTATSSEGTSGMPGTGTHQKTTNAMMSEQQLLDECLTILVTGFDGTAHLLTWTMMHLSQHPEWQEKARDEALAICKGGKWCPSFEDLQGLKTITCILQEVLRLYPALPILVTTATEDIKLSDQLTVPKGCDIYAHVLAMHTNKAYWGPDADEFKPERFAKGVANACYPGAYIPFSSGPRVCIGQNFAMAELKVILGAMLCQFRWRVADCYVHHPVLNLGLKTKSGMPVVLTPL